MSWQLGFTPSIHAVNRKRLRLPSLKEQKANDHLFLVVTEEKPLRIDTGFITHVYATIWLRCLGALILKQDSPESRCSTPKNVH